VVERNYTVGNEYAIPCPWCGHKIYHNLAIDGNLREDAEGVCDKCHKAWYVDRVVVRADVYVRRTKQ